jgi:hypothetical protein
MATALTLHNQKLVYIVTPKVASNTMLSSLLAAAGVRGDISNPYRIFRKNSCSQELRKSGVEYSYFDSDALFKHYLKHKSYRWICVTRDPQSRLKSNYFNKINRYAKYKNPLVYYQSKVFQLIHGPKAWSDISCANRWIKKTISIDDFVEGVADLGVSFDPHYDLQTSLIHSESINYDFMLRIENLQQDYESLRMKLSQEGIRLPALAKLNNSGSKDSGSVIFSDKSIEIIHKIYRKDYEALGYSTV